ncbi:hypothetical protein ACED96_13945 [Clostridium thermobutyricum]|uniref:Uncharacterized protein n=1 Tax=Clostridium thermobutyricum DSM 4928 TaxID=1121339 RepID=A0A1V4SS87_9CLOT|nr:hypothetical protein [Clostridium thermobutyricum]OPX46078.1 hypothetical protein CLTHE_28950 [Clostridium thermobutyricum DSM 4928]OPX46161.1 hypothetical protein CLTHE_29780 [Clostridium thermobutyricum DSM 4928]
MKELFKIKDLVFYEEDFIDNIEDYEDIIYIIQDFASYLEYEKIVTADDNECCNKSRNNYFIQIHGYIDENDEFVTKEEVDKYKNVLAENKLDLFVIRIFKCVDCGKWLIDILE